ncbi:MAG: tetratricopeptide repeat protein [Rhizomicrobium sp.]
MHKGLIGLALALVALPAAAQTPDEEWNGCFPSNTGASIPAEAKVGYCTRLIESGRLSAGNLVAAYNNRGDAYEKMGLFDQEIADDTKAIQIDPKHAISYNNRAWAYHLKGQDAQGLPDVQMAVALDPAHASSLETRAEIYEKLGRRDEAIADYREALKLDPSGYDGAMGSTEGLRRLGVAP